jgi:hypothetical protein
MTEKVSENYNQQFRMRQNPFFHINLESADECQLGLQSCFEKILRNLKIPIIMTPL